MSNSFFLTCSWALSRGAWVRSTNCSSPPRGACTCAWTYKWCSYTCSSGMSAHQVYDDCTMLESLVFDHFNSSYKCTWCEAALLSHLLCLTWLCLWESPVTCPDKPSQLQTIHKRSITTFADYIGMLLQVGQLIATETVHSPRQAEPRGIQWVFDALTMPVHRK